MLKERLKEWLGDMLARRAVQALLGAAIVVLLGAPLVVEALGPQVVACLRGALPVSAFELKL